MAVTASGPGCASSSQTPCSSAVATTRWCRSRSRATSPRHSRRPVTSSSTAGTCRLMERPQQTQGSRRVSRGRVAVGRIGDRAPAVSTARTGEAPAARDKSDRGAAAAVAGEDAWASTWSASSAVLCSEAGRRRPAAFQANRGLAADLQPPSVTTCERPNTHDSTRLEGSGAVCCGRSLLAYERRASPLPCCAGSDLVGRTGAAAAETNRGMGRATSQPLRLQVGPALWSCTAPMPARACAQERRKPRSRGAFLT